jgi:hypothetical protein
MLPIQPTIVKEKQGAIIALPGDLLHRDSLEKTAMRRIVISPKGFQWIDTKTNLTVPSSSL